MHAVTITENKDKKENHHKENINYAMNQTNFTIFKALVTNAVPYTLASLINMGGNFVGVIFVSDLGADVLAACNLTSSIQNWFNSTIGTILSSVSMSVGATKGLIDIDRKNNNHNDAEAKTLLIGRSLHEGWVFGLILTLPAIGVMLASKPILLSLNQNSTVVDLVAEYFYSYIWGLPAMYMIASNRKFTLANNDPKVGTFFMTFFQVFDTGLSYLLINGKCHLPRLGFKGLSYSNTITSWITFFLFSGYLLSASKYKALGVIQFNLEKFWKRVWRQAKQGIPLGSKVAAELASILIASIMIGSMSTDQQAAQEITSQYIYVFSPFMFGIMDTVIPHVTQAYKAGNISNVKKIGNIGIALAVAIACLGLLACIFMPKQLLSVFININQPNNQIIVSTGCGLMLVNGVIQTLDSVRTIALAGLNGVADRWMPTLYIALTLALVNIPLGYILGFLFAMQAIGVMTAREYGVGIGAVVLFYSWMMKNENDLPQKNINRPSIEIQNSVNNPLSIQDENNDLAIIVKATQQTEETALLNNHKKDSLFSSWANYFKSASDNQIIHSQIDQNAQPRQQSWCAIM